MTLTKDDVQTIKGLFTEQMQAIDQRFLAQSKTIHRGFADLRVVMEQTYVSR